MFYPEIDYTIPKEILDKIGDQTKVGDQCLLIPLGPITSVSQAVWICHESPQKLFKMQNFLDCRFKGPIGFQFLWLYILLILTV